MMKPMAMLAVALATAPAPEGQPDRIAKLLAQHGIAVPAPVAMAVTAPPASLPPASTPAALATGVMRAVQPPAAPAAPGMAVCREAAIEDNEHWTLITLKFKGDPPMESQPWMASRRLMLSVKNAQLPAYNERFTSAGQLVSEIGLEQLTPREVRLMMRVAAGTDVTVYKRRDAAADITEYAVLFEVPLPPGGAGGPLAWPVHGRLSSKFGWRLHPILHEHRMHSGIDIAVPEGTPIHAAGAGHVVYADRKGGAGLCVIIEHPGGRRCTYCHCSKLKVEEGDDVERDEVIALAGSTGLSTGPHVHFTVTENGKNVDPLRYLGAAPQESTKKKDGKRRKGPKKR